MVSNVNPSYRLLLNRFQGAGFYNQLQNVHTCVASYCIPKLYQGSGNNNDVPTVMELRKRFMKIRGVKAGFKSAVEDRSYLLKYLPKSQEELPPRSVKDSFLRAVIPLSTHLQLQERYVNVLGRVRFGRLMEDLDMFADCIAMNYVDNPDKPEDVITPYIMVTVLVDHISFTDYLPHTDLDIRVSGHVSGVGKTSIETTVWMDQDLGGSYQLITKAVFLMAARNATLSGGAIVNPIVPADEEEKLILAGGEERRRERSAGVSAGSFPARMPDQEEQRIIHKLFIETMDTNIATRVLPSDVVWMADTRRTNNIFSFTEDRNFHNTVFGGFLMRHATEMAWFTSYFHCKHRPRLRSICDIVFKHPVPLGAIISFHGHVVYTQGKMMQIFVHGDVNDIAARNVTSLVFYFTYESPEPIKSVKPNTYYEAMMYVDGRRHFLEVLGRNKSKGWAAS